jgi:hypothetical protein
MGVRSRNIQHKLRGRETGGRGANRKGCPISRALSAREVGTTDPDQPILISSPGAPSARVILSGATGLGTNPFAQSKDS